EAAEGYLMNARPHPGPLPQERVNHPPLSDDADTHGGRRCAGLKHKAAAAKWSKQFSGNAATLSLSLGERERVTAVLLRFAPKGPRATLAPVSRNSGECCA